MKLKKFTEPLPSEHSCRLRDPEGLKTVGSEYRKSDGKEYRVLFGKPKSGKGGSVEQAYRYKKTEWTAAEAKKHCKDHDGTFEAAQEDAIHPILKILQEQTPVWKVSDTAVGKSDLVSAALLRTSIFSREAYVAALFDDVAIVYDYGERRYYAIQYEIENDAVSFGEFIEVELAYIPKEVQELVQKAAGRLKESEEGFRQIKDTFTCTIELLKEEEGKPRRLKGQFVETDRFNQSEPRRLYPGAVMEKAVPKFNNELLKVGLDGHKDDGGYGDIVLLFEKVWLEEGFGYFEAEIVPETDAGKVIIYIAERKLPILLSLCGRGMEIYEKEMVDKTGLKGGYVVQEGYYIERIDAVLQPAFENAKALLEQQTNQQGGNNMDELKKLIEELSGKISGLETKIIDLEKKGPAIASEDVNTLKELKAKLDAEKSMVEAKKRVAEIISTAEKDFEFKEPLQRHLEKCSTVEEVNAEYPRVKETLNGFIGKTSQTPATHSIIEITEHGFFGAARPQTAVEVYETILKRFKDSGVWGEKDTDVFQNPRAVAKRLIDNYLSLYVSSDRRLIDSRRNPLYHLTTKMLETAGDAEFITTDVTQTAASILPLYVIVLENYMNIIEQAFGLQPLSAPQGKVIFQNEYYGDGAGAWTKINRTNFNYALGQKAEAAAGKLIKVKFESDTINLETALKYMGEWTPEAMQDLMAYYRTNVENVHVQALKNETLRAISYHNLYQLINQTSCSKNDAVKEATGSPLSFSLTPDVQWTGGEWITKAFTKAIKQTAALIKDVDADVIIAPKALSYLFTEPLFVASGSPPTDFGFRYVGTFMGVYKLFLTNLSLFDNKIAVLYRGNSPVEAAHCFLPYILFYLGGLVEQNTGEQSRMLMSRYAIQKVFGQRIAFLTITE